MEAWIAEAKALLAALVAVPSVSAEGRALREGAEKVAEVLEGLGLRAELHEGYGPPVVFAEGEGREPSSSTTTTTSSPRTPWSFGTRTPSSSPSGKGPGTPGVPTTTRGSSWPAWWP